MHQSHQRMVITSKKMQELAPRIMGKLGRQSTHQLQLKPDYRLPGAFTCPEIRVGTYPLIRQKHLLSEFLSARGDLLKKSVSEYYLIEDNLGLPLTYTFTFTLMAM